MGEEAENRQYLTAKWIWGRAGESVEEASGFEQVGLGRALICCAGSSRRKSRLWEAKNGFILDELSWKAIHQQRPTL